MPMIVKIDNNYKDCILKRIYKKIENERKNFYIFIDLQKMAHMVKY